MANSHGCTGCTGLFGESFHRVEFNHRLCSNTDFPNLAPRLLDHFRHPTDHRADLLPVAQPLVLFILCILCIHVQLVENRFSTTWPLFPIGHEDSLFHPRMIRPAGGARHEGARASRPHPSPLATADFQCNAAGSHPVGGNSIGQAEGEAWRRSRWIQVGKMAEAVPGFVRAGRPRSQEAFTP